MLRTFLRGSRVHIDFELYDLETVFSGPDWLHEPLFRADNAVLTFFSDDTFSH